jgi:hypothetical protein
MRLRAESCPYRFWGMARYAGTSHEKRLPSVAGFSAPVVLP